MHVNSNEQKSFYCVDKNSFYDFRFVDIYFCMLYINIIYFARFSHDEI